MRQEIQQLYPQLGAASAFAEPAILELDKSTIDHYLQTEPELEPYRFYLYDLMRKKEHRGTPGEEKIIADAGLISDATQSVFNVFTNAEFPYPEITLHDGKKVRLNQSNFALYRASNNRADRQKVFNAFFSALQEFKNTFGAQLYGNLKKDLFFTRARNYETCLERALDVNNIPTDVYINLVENVHQNLETFQRYLRLRKRILGVDTLHYYDLYAPLISEVDLNYSLKEAQKIILKSLQPLGEDYVATVDLAFNKRWIDYYPSEGKRSGAYSNGSVYDVHPYILMNYNGRYEDLTTLTHELGHTMQSYLSNKTQPYTLAGYPIFVAEVASTLNEALLNDHLLKQIKDDKVKLSLLGNYLEGAKGTLFRQTQFAEFELKIHEAVEKGEALTGDRFNEIYLDITRRYYGHNEGICKVDESVQSEWSFVPHFYYNFYVYQYATAFTASQALSEKILKKDSEATRQYIQFLSAGGSKYPIDLLRDAGVDMTIDQPFTLTMQKLNRVMDEIEIILTKMGK